MTLLYTHDDFLAHDTGPRHPERSERLRQVLARLVAAELPQRCERPTWTPATPEQVERVHDARYVASLAAFARQGGGQIESDTVMSARSFDVARLAAGAAVDAVDRVLRGEAKTALCLVRPPGHHALTAGAMGFCLLNNIAIAARHAIGAHQLDRVLVVDWDVHHGNGTQATFWEDEQVGFLSIHRWPFYPGTGWSDETGTGRALGTKVNLPVEMGTSRREYRERLITELEALAAKLRPQLVLLSAGFDAHHADPVGSLGLETEDFQPLSQAVQAVANDHAEGKIVSVLEGGYNTQALAESVEVHLHELLAHDSSAATVN